MFKKLVSALFLIGFIYVTSAALTPKASAHSSAAPAASTRPVRYYLADRVINNSDFATLSSWGINTAVVDISINGSASTWQPVLDAAVSAGVNIVIWPDQGGDVSGCGWETPFNSPVSGNYISRVTSLLDFWAGNPHVLGIVIAHESEWNQGTCHTLIADMAAVKTQIQDYVYNKFGRSDFQAWNYIDNISDIPNITDYSGPADYAKIMDVAVTWQHCAGNAETACDTGNYSALAKIQQDRALLDAAGNNIELVFIQQTFTSSSPYTTKFTLSQLENYSCEFLNTFALDGFGYYTWNAGWWPDLKSWPDLQPAIPYVYQTCINSAVAPTSTSTATAVATSTSTQTSTTAFTFVSMGDAQEEAANFTATVNQAKTLKPAIVLFNGDLENDGVTTSYLDPMIAALQNAGIYNNTFLIRGNHDDHVTNSAALWESYFEVTNPKTLPSGVTNYVAMDTNSTYLNYSFEYGNAIFIGLDVPGDTDLVSSAQLAFMDARLTSAESRGLVHAFIFWHGPMYCVESTHCTCTAKNDGSCTPTALVTVINKHPIISAFFHGHEHILGWAHMDKNRVSGLTGSFEEFITSPSGGWTYNSYIYPDRVDYYYTGIGNGQGFGAVTVNGNSFTFSIYKVGTTTPVWSQTFTKGTAPATNTPTKTPVNTPTRTPTKVATATKAPPSTATSTKIPTSTATKAPTSTSTKVPTATATKAPTFTATNGPTATSTQPAAITTPPSVPTLVGPANDALTTSYAPRLDWSNSTVPVGTTFQKYELQLAADSTFTSPASVDIAGAETNSEYTPGNNLNPNTAYYWRVRSYNSKGEFSKWSTVRKFRTAVLPPTLNTPTDGANLTYNRPTFTWNTVTGTTGYTIQISRNSLFTQLVSTTSVTTTTYTVTADLPINIPLWWRVQSRATNGPSAWSTARTAITALPPSVPALSAPANSGLTTNYTPRLDWKDSTVPVGTTFLKYELQLAANSTFTSPTSTAISGTETNSEYTLPTNLTPNTTYYWRVRSYNTDGEYGNWSTAYKLRTAVLPPTLSTPTDGTNLTYNRPTFNWNAVTGATGYTIQISRNDLFTQLVSTTAVTPTTYTVTTDLPANVTLWWRVQARAVNGPSAWSTAWTINTASPPSVPVLVAPANSGLTTDYTPRLDWKDSTVPVGTTFQNYELQLAANSTFTSPTSANIPGTETNSEYIIPTDLTPNSIYYWRVRSYNTDGEYGNWSTTFKFRTAVLPPTLNAPASGTNLTFNRTTFTWNAVTGATGYTIQISRNEPFTQLLSTKSVITTTYDVTADLPANATLWWRVQSRATNGPSAWSTIRTINTANAPSVPVLVAPVNNSLTTSYRPQLDWNNSIVPDGTKFQKYELQLAADSAFTSPTTVNITGTETNSSYTPGSNLASNATYYWRVRVYNTDGEYNNWSATFKFRTAITPPKLNAPSSNYHTSNGKPTFDWTDVVGASSYTIQISTTPDFATSVQTATVTTSTYIPKTNLPVGTLYWRVKANGTNGPSLWSSTRSITEQ
jgi:hypothetical protein